MEKLPNGGFETPQPPRGISNLFGLLRRKAGRPVSIKEMNEVAAAGWAGKR